MRRGIASVFAGALAVVLSMSGAQADHSSESIRYKAGVGDLQLLCQNTVDEDGIGGVCFTLDGIKDETLLPISVDLKITDDTGLAVGGYYQFLDAAGEAPETGNFCGDVTVVPPATSVELQVFIDEATGGFDETDTPLFPIGGGCLNKATSPGAGVAGSVTATYTY